MQDRGGEWALNGRVCIWAYSPAAVPYVLCKLHTVFLHSQHFVLLYRSVLLYAFKASTLHL